MEVSVFEREREGEKEKEREREKERITSFKVLFFEPFVYIILVC